MIDKNQTTKLETNDVVIEFTEYPFYPGEELHLSVKPQTQKIDRVSIYGNPSEEQTLVFSFGDFFMFIKNEGLYTDLVNAMNEYKSSWFKDLYAEGEPVKKLCAPDPDCQNCESDIDCLGNELKNNTSVEKVINDE